MEDIRIFETDLDLFEAYSELILSELEEKDRINICLSGGSTPKALFSYWAKESNFDIPWENIRIFWGDERCVPPDDEESNFGMTRKYLLEHINIPQENIFRIMGENDPVEEIERYSKIIGDVVESKRGLPSFDIMMLGMGEDGHTASIFPYQIKLWNSNEYCTIGTHPISGQKRVSVTGKIINNSKVVTFLVTGRSKSRIVQEIIENKSEVTHLYPAALVKPVSGDIQWFLDVESASKLE